MLFKVVAVPIYGRRREDEIGITNLMGGQGAMAKYDPKLVKKISHSKLIACATEVGIKNADKVSKTMLIPAYLDAVEKVDSDGGTSSANVVNMYNEIVTTLGLDKEEEIQSTPEAEPEKVEAPATAPVSAPPPQMTRRPAPAVAAAPNPAPAVPKADKPTREKKAPTPPTAKDYNRWTALGDAVVQMKSGKVAELVTMSNKIYVDLGGKDNVKEASAVGKAGVALLEKVGTIVVAGDSFTYNK